MELHQTALSAVAERYILLAKWSAAPQLFHGCQPVFGNIFKAGAGCLAALVLFASGECVLVPAAPAVASGPAPLPIRYP